MEASKRKYSEAFRIDNDTPPWKFIPDVPLINVYSYLNHKDRVSMSQVCKNWSKGYSAASNWKSIKFIFDKRINSEQLLSAKKFLDRFGHAVKYGMLKFENILPDTEEEANAILIRFRSVCEELSEKAELFKVFFVNFITLLHQMPETFRVAFINCIFTLLRTQNRLQVIGFYSCGFNGEELAQMFNVVGNKSSVLDIQIINGPPVRVRNNGNILHQEDVPNDNTDVENGYCPVLENIVSNFAKHLDSHSVENRDKLKGVLKKMKIDWRYWYAECRGISEDAWTDFRNLFPKIQVELRIYTSKRSYPVNVMTFLIRKNIPLRSLKFIVDDFPQPSFEVPSLLKLFDHIFRCQLQSELEVRIKNFSLENADEIPVHFHKFSALKVLEMAEPYPLTNLSETLEIILNNRPKSLKQIYVKVTKVCPTVNVAFLNEIQEQFREKFGENEITFVIKSSHNSNHYDFQMLL